MKTTNKVQVEDSTAGTSTSTSTTASQWQTYNHYNAEQGWECPRCGRINAPWVRQCDCKRSWSITWNDTTGDDEWWRQYVTCDSNTFKIHPDSITYSTNVNTVAGGCDYKDPTTGDWVNVPKTYTHTNSVKR